jgi:4-hydroxy-2-oxoheptanedioate aldolase
MISQFLDAGMQAVQIPMIGGAEQAHAAVQAAKYAPVGARGVAATRPAYYGQKQPFVLADYLASANEQTMIITQVETREGVANAASIAQTCGVDVVFIGPNDLSQSYGQPGRLNHPDVERALNEITDAVLASPSVLGIMVNNVEGAIAWRKRGARYIMIVLEAVIGPAIRSFLNTARDS